MDRERPPPPAAPETFALDAKAVAALLGAGGPVGSALRGYELRPQQLAMLTAVVAAFNDQAVLTVEAGTGTGKSLAYLIPALQWARATGQRVVVSTRTIALQEQLVRKDLPFLVERAGLSAQIALVKGRGNYLCRRKAAQAAAQPAQLIEDELQRQLRDILTWAEGTRDGSLSDLPVRPHPEVWELVRSEHDNCLRRECPYYHGCFFYTARARAAGAHLLVVNHHLLLADLALRATNKNYTEDAVLPPSGRVIIDEAHHLEDVATAYFGEQVSLATIERLCSRLASRRTPSKGVLPALATALHSVTAPADLPAADGAIRWIDQRLIPGCTAVVAAAEECFSRLLDAVLADPDATAAGGGAGAKLRITEAVRSTALWHTIAERVTTLATTLDAYEVDFDHVLTRLERLSPDVDLQIRYLGTELAALQGRLAVLAAALTGFVADAPDHCAWIEVDDRARTGPALSLHRAPIEVAPLLRAALFERFPTAILTSATLTVGDDFRFLHERIGLDRVTPPERVRTLRLASPFDFANQALLVVPTDLPEPTERDHEPAAQALMRRIALLTRGGTFFLFTAYGALNRTWFELAGALRASGLTPLRQGELARHVLIDRFTRDPGAVLFATDTFWEGIDVRGDALRCVVIARLPFRVPTEPLEQARVDAIAARGGNPFVERALPQAVIKLKQGFGRLIRSRTDRGCVVLLDSRVAHKHYGRVFLEALPPARRIIAPTATALAAMEAFYAPDADRPDAAGGPPRSR